MNVKYSWSCEDVRGNDGGWMGVDIQHHGRERAPCSTAATPMPVWTLLQRTLAR
jgi:hypothetical protein